MALGSTQPLTEMSIPRTFPVGKGGRCVRLTTLPPSLPLSWNLGALTFWNPLGHSRPVTGLLCVSPCHSQEPLLFLYFMYFFLPPFSTNYSSILSHLILPSISWSTSQFSFLLSLSSYCFLSCGWVSFPKSKNFLSCPYNPHLQPMKCPLFRYRKNTKP